MEMEPVGLAIKQEIKEEDEICFEQIEVQGFGLDRVKEENVLNDEENVLNDEENVLNHEDHVLNDEENVLNNEENSLQMIDGHSCFVADGIKEEIEINEDDVNENGEFKEEEINCAWTESPANEPDPLALPEVQDTSETPYSEAAESMNSSSSNNSMNLTVPDDDNVDSYPSSLANNNGEKPLKCKMCDYSSKTPYHLKNHMMTHTGEKPFKCKECGHSFNKLIILKRHMMTHTGEKPFKCKECDYSCTQSYTLKTHTMTHTGKKPLKCEQCDYSCITLSNLKRHIGTHTVDKRYKCKECVYSCNLLPHLNRHLRKTHNWP